ncbi:metalloenzyme superfamily protein [Anaplasma phagocytophilum str. ApWI1]|uniref:Metalloenzyme superfamily protein n=1 Tax=Anaplasma phagocytophilum str. ApWI1 TaxID=1359155 RepID=A0A0F3PWR5_ANAPH|nr:hypothetical protein [Anaplasma phagocytophilum]KJV83082.1 metalloenzyme superfamily protein [Anaplasma phagocytophilum str. HGE2]KJV84467.1 metalloenzyme superfamily protein [Anaplasma phagocytophilum str. ApWI1]KJZ98890.1 metalloenzyme superfamily protein [Anaplasma phagocytophilum str. CR1007]KJV60260.1 metalloenzyme superfamily protein [Anaplasma phagocytophilum str. Webster]KJV98299.1 metalloenzyme superfamily protein [Anaplasma phagocytophilum str. Annie]
MPSPDVSTYDLKPEMSAVELTDPLVERVNSQQYDLRWLIMLTQLWLC